MKRLLIVEEALRDLKAHWFEYIKTITEESRKQGWLVEVACHQNAVPEIQQTFLSFPVFRYARYLDNKTNRLPGDRYYGFILHSWRSLRVLWPLLNQQPRYDLAFAPTVLVHHLLAWLLIMILHPNKPKHLTLFFVTNPGIWNKQSQSVTLPKSAVLLGTLLKLFKPLAKQNAVTFAVETKSARREFEALTGLSFELMPHPVPNSIQFPSLNLNQSLNFACYGFARYEKGSDLLQLAIEDILSHNPDFRANFLIQWVDPFKLPDGSYCKVSEFLKNHSRVTVFDKPVTPDDYQKLLQQADCMILPYRNISYHARVSRIAIESACQGIPMIYTCGGWLEETIEEFSAGIGITDESLVELTQAIKTMYMQHKAFRQKAKQHAVKAKQYFLAANFCRQLLANKS